MSAFISSITGTVKFAKMQCDQMDRLFFNLFPFTTMKICLEGSIKTAQAGTNVRQTIPKIAQRLWKFCQCGKISPNLVALINATLVLATKVHVSINDVLFTQAIVLCDFKGNDNIWT